VGHHGYKTQISIGDNCDFQHVMEHEIGHSVGFWHEQSRPDRDNYISVIWENVLDGEIIQLHGTYTKKLYHLDFDNLLSNLSIKISGTKHEHFVKFKFFEISYL